MRAYDTAMLGAAMLSAAYGQTMVDLRTQARSVDFSAAGTTRPSKTGTVIPAACAVGETFLKTDAAPGKNLYVCTAANVWTVQGIEVPDPTGKANQLLTNDGTALLWRALGGDLTGAPGAATVTGLSGRRLGSLTPLDGQYLKWNGTAAQWEPATLAGALSVFGRTGAITAQNGDYSFAQISGTASVAQLPSTGGDLNGTLTGARVTGLQNRPVGSGVPSTGQVLAWDGAQWTPQTVSGAGGVSGVSSLNGRTGAVSAQTGDYSFTQISGTVAPNQLPVAGGDLNGNLSGPLVAKLQGRTVASTAPSTGQVLGWSGTQWTPQTVVGGNQANLIDKTLSNNYVAGAKQTFVPALSTGGLAVTPGPLPTNPAAGDLAVDSDDANKLKVYDGGQWNTLATSTNYAIAFTAQTSVLVLGTTHKLGTANLLVDCYDAAAPAARVEPDRVNIDALTFNVTIGFAAAQTGRCVISGQTATGGGSGGAGMASQLGDLGLVQTSPTVLTAGLNCTNLTPCNVRLGSTVYSVTTSSTITLSGGTGTVILYLDAAGLLTAGHNLALTCSVGCTAVPGVVAFPAGSLPLFAWSATGGLWDVGGGSDKRAFLSTRNVTAGAGILTLDTGPQTLVAVDAATVPSYLAGSAVVDFAALAPGACGESTFSLPGAAAGDPVAPGWPAGIESGLLGMMRISAANTVAVRLCNFSGASLDPAAATFRATVVRSF